MLFVRIEDLDALWQSLGDTLTQALTSYEENVRTVLSRFGGYEIKREDTTYVYAFQDPAAALRASLTLRAAIQRPRSSRQRAETEDRGPFHVGMGLHIGPLVARTDPLTGRVDYLGTTMNLAARLAMATQGGQTLLTRALMNAAEESGFPVEDPAREDAWIGYRGVHHFRGMNASAEILELRARHQATGALRPLRTTQVVNQPPTTVRLPALSAPLFGREEALTGAAGALQSGERVILLLGPGGVGKSRLAAEFALWCEAGLGDLRFPDGVWWVPLRAARSPEQAVEAVTRALGAPYLENDPSGHLARTLASRSAMLIVLDEADEVATALAPLVRRWRDRAGELRVMITSRSAIPGLKARTIRLGPLRTPRPEDKERTLRRNPAVLLLLDRLRARYGRAVRKSDPSLLATLADVAQRTEGLPLALETMAEQGAGATIEAWVQGMHAWTASQAVHLGPDEVTAQAVRRALNRSLAPLPTWLQAAFAQISVFRGSFSATDIDHVLDLTPWPEAPPPIGALGALLDHCLITRTLAEEADQEALRFRVPAQPLALGVELLSQTRALLRPDETSWSGGAMRSAVERRHLEHFTALGAPEAVRRLDGDQGAAALACLLASQENLVAATRRASRHKDGRATVRGLRALAALTERLGPALLLDGALTTASTLPGVPDLEIADLHAVLAQANLTAGRAQEAREHLGEAIARVPRDGPPGLRGRLAVLTLKVASALGGAQEAWPKLDRALSLTRRAGDPVWITWTLFTRVGWALTDGSEPQGAELEEGLTLARAAGSYALEAEGLTLKAQLARSEGRLDDAWAALRVGLGRARALGPCRVALRAILAFGDTARALGHDADARDALIEALPALVAMNDPVGKARARELTRLSDAKSPPPDDEDAVRSIAPWIS